MFRNDGDETFTIKSGAMFASDPCYTSNVWCAGRIDNVKNGEWRFHAVEGTGSDQGRILELHASHIKDGNYPGTWERMPKTFGVDSGQFGFFDYDYFVAHENERDYAEAGFYNSACAQTLHPEDWMDGVVKEHVRSRLEKQEEWINAGIVEEHGCVSSSGWGDGSYPVFVKRNSAGEVIAVKALFNDNDDEEEDIYEEDE